MAKKTAAAATATATPEAAPEVKNEVTERRPGQNPEVIEVAKRSESEPTTTSKLFPDMSPQEPKKGPDPKLEVKKEEPEEEKKEVSPEPTEPEEFYLEDILEKYKIPVDKLKSRIKVDDKEEVIPFSEFKKRVQLNEHLNRAAAELGRKRREWAEERKRAQSEGRLPNLQQNPESPDPASHPRATSDPNNQLIDALLQRLSVLEARSQALDPVIFDTNKQKVSRELKAEGFDDFLDYIPKMETYIAKIEDPSMQEYYDTDIGAKTLYLKLKSQDLLAERSTPKKEPSLPVKERPEPPIVKMDSGQQPSTLGTDDIDDKQAKYDQLLKRWKQTRDSKDFRELLKLQNALTS